MSRIRITRRSRVISFVKILSDYNPTESGRVIDISAKGMRIRSKKPYQVDQPSHFSMLIPNINFREKVVKFDASVVWSRESDLDGYYESGLHIESVSPNDKSIIEQFIKDSKHKNRWIQVNECFSQEH